jgi:hypothetical protein
VRDCQLGEKDAGLVPLKRAQLRVRRMERTAARLLQGHNSLSGNELPGRGLSQFGGGSDETRSFPLLIGAHERDRRLMVGVKIAPIWRKNFMRRTYRQGDVLVREVGTRDFADHGIEVIAENGRIILARGEVSGHIHSIDARLARLFEGAGPGICYLLMDTQGLLEHQEHSPISLPKGLYEVIRQREYEPRRDRYVLD